MLALIDIIDYTLGSLNEYTRSSIHKIANMLIEDGIATQKNNEENKLFIGNLSRLESIEYCLRNNQITLKCIEKWEFDKNYKYSMLFDIDNITNQMFQGCINLKQIIPYNTLTNFEELYSVAHNPSFLQQKDKYLLKFNLGLESTDFSGNKLKRRYTILAIFYSIEKVLELRFDSLGDVFVSNYIRYVYEVLEWIRKFLNISIKACNLKDIVDHIKVNGEKNGVVLSGQDMLMATGGKATIEVGKNDKMILPFIGELKILMENYKEEFEQVPVLKQAFQDFIFEKENLSEFPWVRFKFKENNFEVKFIFDYGQEKGCLLHHFSSSLKANQGRGRMDYVTNYITRVRNIINKLPIDQ